MSSVAQRLIPQPDGRPEVSKGWRVRLTDGSNRQDDDDPPDEAPETPTNEPKPAPVQDPPAEPGRAPYVVSTPVGRATPVRVEL